jgi:Starch-binding associating with outer membrane
MKIYITKIFLFIGLAFFIGCQDFEELSKNPNNPTNVPASLIFTKVCNDLNENPWSAAHQYSQYWCINYEYYGNQNYSWTTSNFNYNTLYDVQKMEEEAILGGADAANNPYKAIGKFLRAYFFVNMTQRLGDIPLTEALRGSEKITAPKYDEQKAVYVQALNWLEEANADLAALIKVGNTTLAGDIYYNNDLSKWQKAVNAFRLRVLVSLSKRESEVDIKAQFAKIMSSPAQYPLFTSSDDDLAFTYNDVVNKYPTNPDNYGFNATRYNLADTYIGALTSLNDPRVFVVAEPADSLLRSGLKPSDYKAYQGAPTGESLADMSYKVTLELYSYINRHTYYNNYTADNNTMVGYIEQCFNIAEGINRGWFTGSAEEFYNKGIVAAMGDYNISEGANTFYYLPKGKVLGESVAFNVQVSLSSYLNQASVKYKGNNADGLTQILTQKYLGFFQNSGWEAFYNQRRTGIPNFNVGAGNTNGKIPLRWQYPNSERVINSTNWTSALQKQFGNTNDDINNTMWLIK